jgi:hypothetical protein
MKKLNITPGKVEADERGRVWKDESMTLLTDCWGEEDDAVLYADSHNTYHATQMLPSEMAERIKALEDAVQDILNEYDEEEMKMHTPIGYFKHFDRLRALLTPPIDEAHGHLLSNPE